MRLLKGKTVIVTGGSKGIGRACCLAFAREGAAIVFTYNKSRRDADVLVSELTKYKVPVLALHADVRSIDQCRSVVEKTLKIHDKYHVVINNAGITCDRPLFLMSSEEWQKVLDTNLNGVFNMTRVTITNLLKQKDGAIINISSVSGLIGLPGQTNYSASKAGIIGFSKALAKESAPYGVRVNVVAPGFIDTEMLQNTGKEQNKRFVDAIPMKRFGDAGEVAELCAYLASNKARYITGEVIRIDGGLAI
jgi:3-oxoacyl-[acyl-carrier protein] reductase